jgi:hypothetical protein
MAEFFASGHLIDLIFVLVLIEIVVMEIYRRHSGKGVAFLDFLPNAAAGAFLLMALRAHLAAYGWQIICACLAAAGIAHVVDVSRRWKS